MNLTRQFTFGNEQQRRDYFDDAIASLQSNCARLYGGYYEPASDRDLKLAEGIAELLRKFGREPFSSVN
jgi:hypothetical protein